MAVPALGAARLPADRSTAALAPTPPMGWNSWNSVATTITQAQAIEQTEIMARAADGRATGRIARRLPAHGAGLYRLAAA